MAVNLNSRTASINNTVPTVIHTLSLKYNFEDIVFYESKTISISLCLNRIDSIHLSTGKNGLIKHLNKTILIFSFV